MSAEPGAPSRAPTAAEIAAELETMRREQLLFRENIEGHAALIGLTDQGAIDVAVADCSHRLRMLTAACHFFIGQSVTTS